MSPDECPQCGAQLPRRARACPECGSDENTGWNDAAEAHRLGIPDDTFDYESFAREELGQGAPKRPRKVLWSLVAAGLIVVLLRWYWPW